MPKDRIKMPKTLGACADLVWDLRQRRLEAQRAVDDLAAQESAVREHIIQTLPKSEARGVAWSLCRVTVVTKPVPRVEDWPKFYAYVAKTKAFDLLQRRLTDAAVRERWEAGDKLPGVVEFNAVTLAVEKL